MAVLFLGQLFLVSFVAGFWFFNKSFQLYIMSQCSKELTIGLALN